MESFAKKLQHYRELNGLDATEVAFMLGVSEQDYQDMENGLSVMPLKQLVRLCQFYRIRPEVFLDEKKSAPPPVNKSASPVIAPPSPLKKPDPEPGFNTSRPRSPRRGSRPAPANPRPEPNASPDDIDWEKRPEKVTPKTVVGIYQKHGEDITEEQAAAVLQFIDKMARIAIDQALKEAAWNDRLTDEPQGFLFEEKGYDCPLCGSSAEGGWYDQYGRKCIVCQNAINKGIIPGAVCRDGDLYYSEHELVQYFGLERKTQTIWLRQGIIKARDIPMLNHKGRNQRIFLIADQPQFLPPKHLVQCSVYETEERNGQEWNVPLRWYEVEEDPMSYLKDYGISAYFEFRRVPLEQEVPPSETKSSADQTGE